jgi:hypothetical protein
MPDTPRPLDHHAAAAPAPVGGYRRAVPRDALTGEPIRSDTLHIRVRKQRDDRPEPLHQHGRAHSDGHDGHVRYHTPRVHQRDMLPSLDELLDDVDGADDEGEQEGRADDV